METEVVVIGGGATQSFGAWVLALACRMQIEHHTGVETLHPTQLINRASGR